MGESSRPPWLSEDEDEPSLPMRSGPGNPFSATVGYPWLKAITDLFSSGPNRTQEGESFAPPPLIMSFTVCSSPFYIVSRTQLTVTASMTTISRPLCPRLGCGTAPHCLTCTRCPQSALILAGLSARPSSCPSVDILRWSVCRATHKAHRLALHTRLAKSRWGLEQVRARRNMSD